MMGRRRAAQARSGIRVITRSILHRGWVIRVVRDVLEHNGRRMTRDTIQHPGAAVIVPVLGRSQIVLVRQYRHAVRRTLLELPAGTLNRGESPLACARRELQEETGWRAGRMRRIGRFYTAPGILSEQMTLFLAQALTPVRTRPDPDEDLELVVLPLRTALSQVRTGAICDAKTLIGLHIAQRLLS